MTEDKSQPSSRPLSDIIEEAAHRECNLPLRRDYTDDCTFYGFKKGAEWGIEYARKELAERLRQKEMEFTQLHAEFLDKRHLCEAYESQLAELKAENGDHTETIKRQKELLSEAGETLKRYKDALEHLLTDFKKTNVHYQNQGYINFIQSALSGTKETE